MGESARKIFAANLVRYLNAKNKTQVKLTEYVKCSSSTAADWCNGKKYPRPDKMQRIADFLGVKMSDLQMEHDPANEVDVAFYRDYKNWIAEIKRLSAAWCVSCGSDRGKMDNGQIPIHLKKLCRQVN